MHVSFSVESESKTAFSEDYPASVKSAVIQKPELTDMALDIILDHLKEEGIRRFRRVA